VNSYLSLSKLRPPWEHNIRLAMVSDNKINRGVLQTDRVEGRYFHQYLSGNGPAVEICTKSRALVAINMTQLSGPDSICEIQHGSTGSSILGLAMVETYSELFLKKGAMNAEDNLTLCPSSDS